MTSKRPMVWDARTSTRHKRSKRTRCRDQESETGRGSDSAETGLTNELNDAAQNFDLAMRLMNKRDNVKDVATARLLLAYTNFYLRRNYEAAVLAQFVARTTSDEEGSVALDAAYMAMAAFVQAYNDNKAEPDSKQDEMRMIIKAANLIAQALAGK